MKSPAGYRRSPPKKQVRLDLRRSIPPPEPEEEMESRQRGNFWKWFILVALLHLLVLLCIMIFYRPSAPPPPTQFISLVSPGETVKGTPGAQAAPKVGPSTPAPAHHHHHPVTPTPPQPVTPPPPAAVQPPEPKPTPTPPVVKQDNAPAIVKEKPKHIKPPTPKVKVDLTLQDGPEPTVEKHKAKPAHKKHTPPPSEDRQDDQDTDSASPDTSGLSKEQIAKRLGEKLGAEGVKNSTLLGDSGSPDGHNNPFGDFYDSLVEQVMNKWQNPDQDDLQAIDPVVQIHVEKNGRVPPESVSLKRSSGNQAIDDSALSAARNIGYTLQPLPDGCPPDISIFFKLSR